MRSRSVVLKLWLAFVGLILAVVVPLEVGLHHLMTDFYQQQVTEPLLYHSQQLASTLARDPQALHMSTAMAEMVGGEVLILDPEGKRVNFPGSADIMPPPEAAAAATRSVQYVGHMLLSDGGTYIVAAASIPERGGAVILMAPAAPVQASLTVARRFLWLAGGGILLAGTALALLMARSLLRPVIAIERATRSIAQGDFSTRVEVNSADELGQLAGAVNQMTAQLETYEDRRREFLANVAHELRTPLSYIRGYTQALAEGLVADPAERERYQRIVQEESVRVGRLVDDLMDLAQMDEGQLSLDRVRLDLRLPVEQAMATIRPLAEEKGVRVQARLPEHLPQVEADGGRLQQVVFNLLDNALRYTPAGGSITVSAAAEPGWVTIRVADTGQGIPPQQIPLIFERFQKRHSQGRGLGLAIVRSIIRAHGGEVGVESEPGRGSIFWFRLRT